MSDSFETARAPGSPADDRFASALRVRNRLNHGFFERHNFRIQTDEGRDAILADLEDLHDELFNAWQIAGTMTKLAMQAIEEERPGTDV